jgi:DNA-binding transcriptional ArsR family regulator
MEARVLLAAETTNLNVKARFFRGFSDPSRLKILETLRAGEWTVGAIVEQTGLSQSNVSNHLACLRDCGLVTAEQRGKYVAYKLSDPRVDELLTLAEILLADVARGVYECTRYDVPTEKNNG